MLQPGGGPPSPIVEWFQNPKVRRCLPAAVLVLLPTLLVLSGAGGDFTLLGSDMVAGSYQIRGLVGRLLREGRLPVWDSHTMCGFPLLAAMQAGVFYPLTWPAAFVSPGPFWTATVLVHLILAGQFAFGWLRRGLAVERGGAWVGACVFMLSGYILTRVLGGHISQICSYPWLAAVLWRTERILIQPTLRRWILLALSVTLLILPGFPQFVMFAAFFIAIRLAAFRVRAGRAGMRTLLLAASAGAAGALFAAPQLLATLELLPEVQRVSGISYEFATQLSVPWPHALTLLAPSFFGDDTGLPYWSRGAIWEVTGFVGIGALILGALATRSSHPQRFFWAGAAGLAALLALGSETPIFKAFYYTVPGAKLFRQPGRYLALFTLAMAALSALGFDRLWKDGPGVRRSARAVAVGAGLVLVLLLAGAALWGQAPGTRPESWRRFVAAQFLDPENLSSNSTKKDPEFSEKARHYARSALLRASLPLAILSICLFAVSRDRLRPRTCAVVSGAVLAAELVVFGSGFFRPYDPRQISWPPEFVDFVKNAPGYPFRIVSPGAVNIPQIGKCQLAGLDHLAGYESMLLRRYCELINVVHGRPPDLVRLASSVNRPHPVLDMLGAKLWLVSEGLPVPPGWKAVGKVNEASGDSVVLLSPHAYPRAFLVSDSVTIPSRDERLRFLMDPSTDLGKVVVLEVQAARRPRAERDGARASRLRSFKEGEYEIATESASEEFLVLTETFYPGWEARIDGAPAEILRANHLVQAVLVPPGRHTVRLEYHPRWLWPGLLVSLASILGVLGVAWRLRGAAGPVAPP
jgi:hypothetical protein